MKHSYRLLLFVAAFLLFILFGQGMPVTDPVESNYALTAKEMLLSNDWLSPRIYNQVWFDKPVMFYWLLGIAFKVFGVSELAARIIPAFFGACAISLMEWFVSEIATPRQGLIAAGVLATSLQYFVISKLLITDIVLFVFDSAAMVFFCLGFMEARGTKQWYLLMYPCLALGVLTKGPIGALLPMLIIALFLVLQKKWSELDKMRIVSGTLLFLAIASPWYILMYLAHGNDFVTSFFGVHNYLRATVSEHPKDNVFYYYFAVFGSSTLPWTGLAVGGLYTGYKGLRAREPKISLLAIWALVYFVFYSFMATKYLTYTFPMLFAVAVLTAVFVDTRLDTISTKNNFLVFLPLLFLGIALIAGSYRYLDRLAFGVFSSGVVVILAVACYQAYNRDLRKIVVTGLICTVTLYVLISALVVPAVAKDRSGKDLAEIVKEYHDYQIGTYGFYSTSAVFYSGHILVKLNSGANDVDKSQQELSWSAKYTMPISSLSEFSNKSAKRIVIVPSERKRQFEQDAAKFGYREIIDSYGYVLYELIGEWK